MHRFGVSDARKGRKWQCSIVFPHRVWWSFIEVGFYLVYFEFFGQFLANGGASGEDVSGGGERKLSLHKPGVELGDELLVLHV